MKICIVTPSHLSVNPRVVKEATALAGAGYAVHIVHGHFSPAYAARDAALCDPAWGITRVAFGPALASTLAYARQTLVRRTAAIAAPRLGMIGAAATLPAAPDLAAAAAKVRADLYIGHYVAALPAVARAARRHGAPYAFDAEDFHPGDLPDEPRHRLANRVVDAVERRTLPGAAFVTAASPGIAEAYAARYAVPPPTVVLNVFPLADAPAAATPGGTAAPSLYWFSRTRGGERGLECLLEAAALAHSRPTLFLRGDAQEGFDARFLARAAALGIAERVSLLPSADPAQMVPLAAGYDAGFVGETGATQNRRIALTNKQFTYLLAGIPAVMSDIAAHRAFAATAPGAVVLYRTGDAADLARVLDALYLEPGRLCAARTAAWRLGQGRFNFEAEAGRLLSLVERALAAGPRR